MGPEENLALRSPGLSTQNHRPTRREQAASGAKLFLHDPPVGRNTHAKREQGVVSGWLIQWYKSRREPHVAPAHGCGACGLNERTGRRRPRKAEKGVADGGGG